MQIFSGLDKPFLFQKSRFPINVLSWRQRAGTAIFQAPLSRADHHTQPYTSDNPRRDFDALASSREQARK